MQINRCHCAPDARRVHGPVRASAYGGTTFRSASAFVTGESVASSVSGAFWGLVFAASGDSEGEEIYGLGMLDYNQPIEHQSRLNQWVAIRNRWWNDLGQFKEIHRDQQKGGHEFTRAEAEAYAAQGIFVPIGNARSTSI